MKSRMESKMSSPMVIGVDIGKEVFDLVGFTADGKIAFRRRIRRLGLKDVFEKLPPCIVAMEDARVPRKRYRICSEALGKAAFFLSPRRCCRTIVKRFAGLPADQRDRMSAGGPDVRSVATSPQPASAGAERMRRHRKQRRKGLRCINIQLRETGVDALIRRGLLAVNGRNDRNAVEDPA